MIWDFVWALLSVLGAIGAGEGISAAVARRRRARKEEATYAEQQAAAQARQADQDDLYPARPAMVGAAGPDSAAGDPAAGGGPGSDFGVSGQPADYGPPAAAGLGAALAALTQGETVAEEIERLEARLTVLYGMLEDETGKALAADVAATDQLLASGVLERADWLDWPGRWCPCHNLAGDCDGWHTFPGVPNLEMAHPRGLAGMPDLPQVIRLAVPA